MDNIKDILYTFSRRIKFKRLSLKDYIINLYLKIRWSLYRISKSKKNKNYSCVNKKGFELTFEDNFDRISWGTNQENKNWIIGEHWGEIHHQKPNVYYGPPKVKLDKTIFTCEYKPKEFVIKGESVIVPYQVSLLSTAKSFTQKFGRFECRMTLPDAPHSWPSFWMWGPSWPPEIDVIETLGKNTGKESVYQEINIHYGHNHDNTRKHIRPWLIKVDKKKNLGRNFYEFAVEWSPNKIEFFTNGIKVYQYTNKEIIKKYISSGPMWMIINNSIRNYNEHNPYYYSEFTVDYIRAYQFKNK